MMEGMELIKGEEEKLERAKRKYKKREKENQVEEKKIDQDKFFIDVSKDQKAKELINNLISEANNKKFGREIILKDLLLVVLPKLTAKDIEAIQNNTLSDLEKLEKQCFEYNQKHSTNHDLGYFLVQIKNVLKESK